MESNKTGFLVSEIGKIEDKLHEFHKCYELLEGYEERLANVRSLLKLGETIPDETRAQINSFASELKSTLSDLVKAHRDVHPPISKFGKFIDKNCAEDLSSLTAYFIDRVHTDRTLHVESAKRTGIAELEDDDPLKLSADSLRLVIIEHLLRHGRESLVTSLVQDFSLMSENIDLNKFRGLSNLMSTLYHGDLKFARNWLSEHKEQLGNQTDALQYTLAKLDFLEAVRQHADDPTAILNYARRLVPFAQTYAADFEHLMGSLVFLGRSLRSTPYEDLDFTPASNEPMNISSADSEQTPVEKPVFMTSAEDSNVPSVESYATHPASEVLSEAAELFRACYCRLLNLSNVDPLCTVFVSGCRLLSRQQNLQRAISCLTKYSNADGDMLPIAVELDPVAHRHNIFHCPVMKEVVTTSNGPVRLSCGHAISRDAFESLPNSDRRSYGMSQSGSKVKCPYCPIETYKNQALDLYF